MADNSNLSDYQKGKAGEILTKLTDKESNIQRLGQTSVQRKIDGGAIQAETEIATVKGYNDLLSINTEHLDVDRINIEQETTTNSNDQPLQITKYRIWTSRHGVKYCLTLKHKTTL